MIYWVSAEHWPWCLALDVFPSFSSPRPLFPGHHSSFAQKGRSMPSLGRAARHRSCNLTDTRACVSPLLGDIFSHVFIRNSDGFHPSEMSQVLDSPLSLWWKCLPFSHPSPLNLSVPSVYCQCLGIFIPFIFIMMKRTGNERIRFAIFVAFLSVQFSGNKSTDILMHPSPPSSSRSPSFFVDWALYPLIKGRLSPLTPCPWGPPFYLRSQICILYFCYWLALFLFPKSSVSVLPIHPTFPVFQRRSPRSSPETLTSLQNT